MHEQPYRQEADVSTLSPAKKYCHACASILDVRAEMCPRCGVRQLAMQPLQHIPVATPTQQVVMVGGQKSAGTAVLLALLFGPLGMIYSTGVGALVMFLVNLFMIVGTAGIGLIVTIPVGCIWAASAANSYNEKLQQQAALMIRR